MTLYQREATPEDLVAIGRIAAAAFHPSTDAISRRLFPLHLESLDGPNGDAARLWRQARKTASLSEGRNVMTVVVDGALEDQIVGFCLWESPVSEDVEEHDKARPRVPDPEPPAALDREAFKEMQTVVYQDIKSRFGERGTKDVWHLDYLGVDPNHQRRGIGRMAVRWGVELADKTNKDCYLIATPAGRPLYLKEGFEELGTLNIFGVPHYPMIRKPSETT